MTEHQFAQLLTTMNQGDGVPVTISHVNGKRTPPLPETKTEAAKITDKFRDDIAKWKKQLSTTMAEVDAIIAKKGALNVEEKKRLTELTTSLVGQIENHSTFLLDQFDESVAGVIGQAKAEVEGFINSAVQRTGLEALKGASAAKLLGMGAPKKEGE
jgi:Cdc6-like AAA superfamily ATPase